MEITNHIALFVTNSTNNEHIPRQREIGVDSGKKLSLDFFNKLNLIYVYSGHIDGICSFSYSLNFQLYNP